MKVGFTFFIISFILIAIISLSICDLISESCRKTGEASLCESTLRADPRSAKSDVSGLARIAIENSEKTAKIIYKEINDLIEKETDPLTKSRLHDCSGFYQQTIEADLPYAIQYLESKEYWHSESFLTASIDTSVNCEYIFSEGPIKLKSPLTKQNDMMSHDCNLAEKFMGGKLLLELNRLLQPGGYFVWSATPVYRKEPEDKGIWKAMSELTKSMSWDLVAVKDKLNEVGAAFYKKPTSNECFEIRMKNEPPLCKDSDDPDAAWNVPLEACIHKVPVGSEECASQWPEEWPLRAGKAPKWLKNSQVDVYGKSGPGDIDEDYKHWKNVVSSSYLNGMGIKWSSVRNVMDMKAVYGGFAAALKDLSVWVMNVVPTNSPDTLPLIYDRGFFGTYHDWCESFSTYPRTYDLLHADHFFFDIKKRCKILPVIAEVDRIFRPEGYLIIRDKVDIIAERSRV